MNSITSEGIRQLNHIHQLNTAVIQQAIFGDLPRIDFGRNEETDVLLRDVCSYFDVQQNDLS